MVRQSSKSHMRIVLALLVATSLLLISVPPLSAAPSTPTPKPLPTRKNSSNPSPTPSKSPSFAPLRVVYEDTNVPQIISLTSSFANTEQDFVVSVALDVRIRRNTISTLSIGLSQKTTSGIYVDPIFQAPCTKLGNLSVSSLNSNGDSIALQSRAADGDWYLERYVLTNKTKRGTNQVPCIGQYLITSMSIVDTARHNLNVTANLASTAALVPTNPTPPNGSNPQANIITHNDNAIMTSNIWNSRMDLAPCTAGTNLLPAMKTVTVSGRATQVLTPPTILPTNRIACAPTINFDFTKPLVTILTNADATGLAPVTAVGAGNGLPIFDYAAANQNSDLEKLKKEIEDLKKKNAKLTSDLAKYKKSRTPTKQPSPKASPSATRRS